LADALCHCCLGGKIHAHHHDTLRCRDCGHAWFPPERLDGPPEDLYDSRYFQGGEYEDYQSEEQTLKRRFRSYCTLMRRLLPAAAEVLEIGCAFGFFLEVASEMFSVSGIDVSEVAVHAARARGLRARVADLSRIAEGPGQFDSVCMWDCIEHLADPAAYVEAIGGMLRRAGTLLFTTSDLGALLPRLQGGNWRQYHPPTHLHYFTRPSIRILLSRFGFQILDIRAIAQWHSLSDIVSGLAIHSRVPFLSRVCRSVHERLPRGMLRWSLPLLTGDIIWVAAQRKEVRDVPESPIAPRTP
jgi:SAM-dependent methyltransferase